MDLPFVTLCRSKFNKYPEYHTSLDDLNFVTPSGLQGGFDMVRQCLEIVEYNPKLRVTCLGEPQLGKRGLYPSLSVKGSVTSIRVMKDVIAYADGRNDLIEISNLIEAPMHEILRAIDPLIKAGLLEEC